MSYSLLPLAAIGTIGSHNRRSYPVCHTANEPLCFRQFKTGQINCNICMKRFGLAQHRSRNFCWIVRLWLLSEEVRSHCCPNLGMGCRLKRVACYCPNSWAGVKAPNIRTGTGEQCLYRYCIVISLSYFLALNANVLSIFPSRCWHAF